MIDASTRRRRLAAHPASLSRLDGAARRRPGRHWPPAAQRAASRADASAARRAAPARRAGAPSAALLAPPISRSSTASPGALRRRRRPISLAAAAPPGCRSQLHPAPARLPAEVQAQIDAMSISTTPFERWSPRSTDPPRQRPRAKDASDPAAKQAAQQAYQQALTKVAREAASRSLLRALYSPNQLQEQMTWFWFNHFNVHQYKTNLRVMVGDYEDRALRPRALGRFRDLLIASATHPAMIRYLDNEQNAAGRINENYAREVMELHTLGVDGGYSQADVQELARVLTGLGVNFSDKAPNLKPGQRELYVRQGFTEFNPARHDMGEKVVLGHRIAGRGWNEVLDELAGSPRIRRPRAS